ncbi:acyl-CoA dehydrogenase family protein [Paenibacillus sp. ACRRX]|uniref:acyl-CoA dehydrogenase family protein n=1 Tax=Paenibacillus sp. ACRRX TaxID=2918206 RepID=UPI001EF4D05A|nr:acyl-CoA dehydrogenase family protein [Paenibacillus sp. ACRRX]MCG7407072.1 acyl-CoA dehydrogenase family protein [Paenibacillus sp. ACRRX]
MKRWANKNVKYTEMKRGNILFIQNLELTNQQMEKQEEFKAFVDSEIVPAAGHIDQEENMPDSVLQKIIDKGNWGAALPAKYGGADMDYITYGLWNEEIGRGCASLRNIIGVQGMVTSSILRWGSQEQKQYWLPKMSSGELKVSFAITESQIGSDIKNLQTKAQRVGTEYVISGQKKWITFAQKADVFLVFAQCDGQAVALLVERNTPGLTVRPISGLVGFRGSLLAELSFEECRVPVDNLVGKVGFGLALVANNGLTHGRYSTAWGAAGLAQACLNASLDYVNERKQFDHYLKEHQLIQQMIADMVTNTIAARHLCFRAGQLWDNNEVNATFATSLAKYFSTVHAFKAAKDAVQIHGANGCSSEYPVERHMRDAKVMEIVEGSTQIQQVLIAQDAFNMFNN